VFQENLELEIRFRLWLQPQASKSFCLRLQSGLA